MEYLEADSSSSTNSTTENLKPATVLGVLVPVASEWKNIGTFLEISNGELNTIGVNYPSRTQDCLREMINSWLTMSDPVLSWERLWDAVNRACGDGTAMRIYTKYITSYRAIVH